MLEVKLVEAAVSLCRSAGSATVAAAETVSVAAGAAVAATVVVAAAFVGAVGAAGVVAAVVVVAAAAVVVVAAVVGVAEGLGGQTLAVGTAADPSGKIGQGTTMVELGAGLTFPVLAMTMARTRTLPCCYPPSQRRGCWSSWADEFVARPASL